MALVRLPIDELPLASSVGDDDLLVVSQDGIAKKAPKSLIGGGGGNTVVASYYNPSSADISLIPELNGIFYTVPEGQSGLYKLSITFTTPGAFVAGVDSAQISAWLNGDPGLDTIRIIYEGGVLYQGGEGTQAALHSSTASLLLNEDDTITLASYSGGTISVLVRLELLALAADL
jgi:hypothetical protein